MADEKDRFGEKLHQSEKALEDQWARKQDAELMEKMRAKSATAVHCPKCNDALADRVVDGLHMLVCPQHHGAWLDASALETLLKK